MMKGLSYPGGLSRETTAMLCDVERRNRDGVCRPAETRISSSLQRTAILSVNVFRTERDGLVFYEVTPLDKPTMTEYLQVPVE